ncbi:hypothetical protein BDV93DRAFT_559397 [Ceratobasidium sp. AG-I]|nr:hypothetical protein BDV93DRAFT_559397 [Ceratobasidium sp. AG-I]
MPSVAAEYGLANRELYDLYLVNRETPRDPVILKASLRSRGSKPTLPMDPGDETFNLSAVLGNKNGKFKWGSGGFEQSSRPPSIELRGSNRFLCVELQNKSGGFNLEEINLDEHFELLEYVHRLNKEAYYKLGMRKPPTPQRTLVLCFDGTSNHFSNRNTNVVKFMDLLKKNDPERQMVYYQTGVGTYAPPSYITSIGLSIAKKADEGLAWYLYQHVMDGYKFLVETYCIGDRISIFGFSRGAFTARALAGMVHCVGLLPRHNIEHIPFAYDIYRNTDENRKVKSPDLPVHGALYSPVTKTNPSSFEDKATPVADVPTENLPTPKSKPSDYDSLSFNRSAKPKNINPDNFKKAFCIPVEIDFVGVWDTVASVGSWWPQKLPYINYNASIRNFRQALALDESRANFIPSVWDHSKTNHDTQNVQEVWFKGGHTDVGGGAPIPKRTADQSEQSLLSNITLRWMVRQCLELDTGIIFDCQSLHNYRMWQVLEERPMKPGQSKSDFEQELLERSAELDKKDIVYEPYDARKGQIGWNVLEFWPSWKPTQRVNGLADTFMPNFYKPRSVYCPQADFSVKARQSPVAIHASVVDFLQMQGNLQNNRGKKYIPRALWHGYTSKHLPWIEDGLTARMEEGSKATDAVLMDWKPKETRVQALRRKVKGLAKQ